MSAIAGIVVHTVGHSTHDPEAFVALLRRHGVELLADVRRHPVSRRVPWTNAGELRDVLARAGIGYEHLPGLGGRRRAAEGSPNGGWTNKQFRGYADHMTSAEFEAAVERLLALAGGRRAALMCAEAQWWRCHRRLLADALIVRGARVLHVDARGAATWHELTPFAVVEDGRLRYPPAQAELDV